MYKKKVILLGTLGIYTVAEVHIILQLTVVWVFFGGKGVGLCVCFCLLWTCEEENWAKPQCKELWYFPTVPKIVLKDAVRKALS